MKKQFFSRSGLLVMEIIFSILSFSVVSAICLQAFVKSHTLAQDAGELNMAVQTAVSAAEILSGADSPAEHLREMYPEMISDGHSMTVCFDKDFCPCSSEEAAYRLEIAVSPADEQTTSYFISVYDSGSFREIYHLETTVYRQYTLQKGAP